MPAALIQALAEARAEAWSWRQRALQLEAELVRGGAWAGVKELEEELRSLKTSWKAGQVRMAALEMERQELWKEATALRADRDRAHAVLRAASDLREAAEIPSPSPYALDLPPSRLSAAGPAWSVSQPWAASAEDLERGPAPKRSGGGALAALEDPALRLALARLLDGSGTVIGSPPLDEGPVLRPGSNPLPPAALQALAGHSLLNAAARGAAGAAGAAPLAAVPPRPSSGGLRLAPSALGRGPSPGAASAAQAPLRSALEVLLQAQGARAQGMDPSTLQALAAEMVALQNQRNA